MNRVFHSVLSAWDHKLTVMRLFLSFLPLFRTSGKDKTMKRIPKTPIEFDYDIWTTEDGKCMVRVKLTGEVTEVDREVMKVLRVEEKRLRRSYSGSASKEDDGEENNTATVLSLDALPNDDVKSSAWLADPVDHIETALTEMCIQDFRKTLTANQCEIFDVVLIGGMGVREYARQKGLNHKTIVEAVASMRKKLKKYF